MQEDYCDYARFFSRICMIFLHLPSIAAFFGLFYLYKLFSISRRLTAIARVLSAWPTLKLAFFWRGEQPGTFGRRVDVRLESLTYEESHHDGLRSQDRSQPAELLEEYRATHQRRQRQYPGSTPSSTAPGPKPWCCRAKTLRRLKNAERPGVHACCLATTSKRGSWMTRSCPRGSKTAPDEPRLPGSMPTSSMPGSPRTRPMRSKSTTWAGGSSKTGSGH